MADEVRLLARRSVDSGKETAARIQESITCSKNGIAIGGKISHRVNEIVVSSREVDSLMADITTASKEQNQGLGQLNAAAVQLDKLTQKNAATAEESASVSTQLNVQVEATRRSVVDLFALVGRVQLSGARMVSGELARKRAGSPSTGAFCSPVAEVKPRTF